MGRKTSKELATKLWPKSLLVVPSPPLSMPNPLSSTPVESTPRLVTLPKPTTLLPLLDGEQIPKLKRSTGSFATRGDNIGEKWDTCGWKWARTCWALRERLLGPLLDRTPS